MHPLAPNDPSVIGRYQLLACLGQGGMGRVYLAIGPDGKRLAVKQIAPALSADPDFHQRFALEVDAARRVADSHTVPVIDADTASAAPWSATEFVPGPTLTEAIDTTGVLPEQFVRRLGMNLAVALRDIHDAGLIHRDIKPSNVLLSQEGAKLLDFGISRAKDYSTSVALTQTGGVVGSPAYMSPEQAESQPLTEKSDVFSLGCLLASAASGRAPFEGSSIPQTLYKVVHGDPDLEGIPESLKDPITRCLDKDPEQRPSPAELGELLQASGEATESLPLVDDFVARQEAQIVALRPGPPPNPTMVDTGPTMVHPQLNRGMSGRKKGIIAAGAALALLLLIAIPVTIFSADSSGSSADGGNSSDSEGDAAGADAEDEDALELPSEVCSVLDVEGVKELRGEGVTISRDPEGDTDAGVTCDVGVEGGTSTMMPTIFAITVGRVHDGMGPYYGPCRLEGCDSFEAYPQPYGDSEDRPWDKGAIVEAQTGLEMMWYEGDVAAWVRTVGDLDDGSEAEREFLLQQGTALYDHVAE